MSTPSITPRAVPVKKPASQAPKSTVKKKDVDLGTYYFFKALDDAEAKNIIEFLLKYIQMSEKDRPKKLMLIINSPGGCLYSALAIVDMIRAMPVPVHAIVTGCAASAASLIFSACHARVMTKHSFLMTHQYSTVNFGKYHEIKSARFHEDEIEKMMVDFYVETTKLPEAVVRSTLLPETDVYLSSQKSKEFGLCDLIM